MRIAAAKALEARVGAVAAAARLLGGCLALIALSACAGGPQTASNGRVFDPKLGVWSSPRVVAEGDAVPRGGGSYLTGRPYVIGGRTYVPSQNPAGYTAVGMASWYGDAFHGRRTANGEIFDKGSISAAHPTLPLPSYVRVTNLRNNRSIVVRVNDRGPYHGGRVMDVSQRVADALAFRGEGTAHVRIEYIGRAPLQGSDDGKLAATLRTDGTPAQIEGQPPAPPVTAAREEEGQAKPAPGPEPAAPEPAANPIAGGETAAPAPPQPQKAVPLPPIRPLRLGLTDPAGLRPNRNVLLAALNAGTTAALGDAGEPPGLTLARDTPFRSTAAQGTLGGGGPPDGAP